MTKIVECVPNFSEGKDFSVIEAISGAIKSVKGVKLLNVDPGSDFNRTVYTFVGEPEAVLKAAYNSAKIGLALIDMQKHKGEHARMGSLDVMPFIPIKNVTNEECIELSKKFGEKISEDFNVPVFLYAKSATKSDRIKLPDIRKGEYEALEEKFKDSSFTPDYGKAEFNAKNGATATGCRDILIAYNINLDTNDKKIAAEISGNIRTSGKLKKDEKGNKIIGSDGKPERIPGLFKGVQAGGMMYNENISQVSMNLLNFRNVNLHHVYEEVKNQAKKHNIKVTGSEIVGLIPKESLLLAGRFYSKKNRLKIQDEEELVSLAIDELGLSDLYEFLPEEKIIEYMFEESGLLSSKKVKEFLTILASKAPAPGGGSVAALSGALGSALSSMVCNLTLGKEKYDQVQKEIKNTIKTSEKLRRKLTNLIDKDTQAFNEVIKAFKMPKESEEEINKRKNAIQEGYKKAANIPFETAKTCAEILDISTIVAEKGNINSITDAAVSAIMAKAGVESAILNVKINLGSIKDENFVNKSLTELNKLEKTVTEKTDKIIKIVNKKIIKN